MSRANRHRVLKRAVTAWQAGRPHEAWQELHQAGMVEYWPTFQRAAFHHARVNYERRMSRYAA